MRYAESFRQMLDNWDNFVLKEKKSDDKTSKIKNLLDGNGYMLFFKQGNNLFGSPEEGRIVYANLKNPDTEETPDGWEKDANFAAFDLFSALSGVPTQTLFSAKDLPNIKVIDRDEIAKLLLQCPDIEPPSEKPIGIIDIKVK